MRRPKRYIRWCNVYLEADSQRAIIALCFNHDGLQAEIPGGARLLEGSGDETLGVGTLEALEACLWEPTFNYRDAKPSDWPAYQASGESTIKGFQQRWRCVRVAGANDHNVTWVLSVALDGDFGLEMTAAVAPTMDAGRLGQALRYLDRQVDDFPERRG